jgi:hypothetical protein
MKLFENIYNEQLSNILNNDFSKNSEILKEINYKNIMVNINTE